MEGTRAREQPRNEIEHQESLKMKGIHGNTHIFKPKLFLRLS